MKKLISNNEASAVPLLLFFLTIFACGGLYTFFFIEFAQPTFNSWIPASDAKTFIMMCIYAIPLFIVIIGILSLLMSGLKYNFKGGPIR